MHFIQLREIGLQRFAQGIIQRVDRAVALRCGVQALSGDTQLDEGFGDDRLAGVFLDEHFERFEAEQLIELAGCFAQE
ncbi:hypothetical protein D3C73_1313750 [compost metagenome]